MSMAPPKKSDLGKSWMKPRRDKHIRIQPEYHLIVTEGTKTEPEYFQQIRDRINAQYTGRIQLDICGEGENTVSLLQTARIHAAQSPNGYKHVWVVYDTDDFPADKTNKVADECALTKGEDTEYHAIWSNQCIELWFLLHFCYFDSDIDRSAYKSKLSYYLKKIGVGSYKKNRNDMFEVLRPYLDTAIANAMKLEQINDGRTPKKSAPGTMIHKLINHLRPYLTR